jgi:S-adenosylmethionine:tRNA ribosyltransferase-isomerase
MTRVTPAPRTRFVLPVAGEATSTPEQRGLARDEVRLLVVRPDGVTDTIFRALPDHLDAGDLVVVNTSATLPAALDVIRAGGSAALLHVAGELDDGSWVVEVRAPDNRGPATDVVVGERLTLPGAAHLVVQAPYPDRDAGGSRLWRTTAQFGSTRARYLHQYGRPIGYRYLTAPARLTDVQTVYADEAGSAEMPSAGRPFTDRMFTRLMMRGIGVAPLVLHTSVSSPDKHELPVPEPFRVPDATARLVNSTRAAGGRVVAVGTTVVRALETVADPDGTVRSAAGWTDLVISPDRPVRVVDALVSGLHEPQASHLLLLEAVAGGAAVAHAYTEAVDRRYLWHEFGDSMLFLPERRG